jgi:nicotinamide mononucleotide transporter
MNWFGWVEDFLRQFSPWELVAAGLGFLNVGLLVRRSVWNYPFGLAMVTVYFFVFRDVHLYSDMLLQIFFFVVQLYGWWSWVRAKKAAGEVQVDLLDNRERALCIAATAAVSLALGWFMANLGWIMANLGWDMANYTPAASPYIDASIAGMSITAQLLLAWRKLENWVLWIVADVVGVGLYLSKGLQPTAVLYAVFLLLSLIGLIDWWRKLRKQGRPA